MSGQISVPIFGRLFNPTSLGVLHWGEQLKFLVLGGCYRRWKALKLRWPAEDLFSFGGVGWDGAFLFSVISGQILLSSHS